MRIILTAASCLILVGLFSVAADREQANLQAHRTVVAPFLKKHCLQCHNQEKQRGKLSLHDIDGNLLTGNDATKWRAVADRLVLDEMPPAKQPRPDAVAKQQVINWINAELRKAGKAPSEAAMKLLLPEHGNRVDHATLFSKRQWEPVASPARLWRMSPHIYDSYVPRIGGQKIKDKRSAIAQPFSTSSAGGFKDYAVLFAIDEPTINQLMRNAGQIVDGQLGLNRAAKKVKEFSSLLDAQKKPTEEQLTTAIRRQFQMALFREPTNEEAKRFLALMHKNINDSGQVIGVKSTLATVLMLPEAMYRFELGRGTVDEHGRMMLSPRELAYAISFALTDEPPRGDLLNAVEKGRLATREDVKREVERMLNEKKLRTPRIMRFFEEYFEFPTAEEVFKDLKRGQWRPQVLVNDTRLLIEHILERDRDVFKELLTTNKSFVNYKTDNKGKASPAFIANKNRGKPSKRPQPRKPEIHDFYSLPEDWKWTAKQPIELPADQRAGILTQPSWLAAFATNNETHAILRGKWIRERLLGGVIPDLPITVDAKLPDAPEKTMRERMQVTQQEYCWQCHQKMNPLGLTFEQFDYLGRHRTTETVVNPNPPKPKPMKKKKPKQPEVVYHEVPLDTSGAITDSGERGLDGSVKNAVQMLKKLAGSERARQMFVRHAFRFWMGRNELLQDAPTLQAADEAYVKSSGSMKALIVSLLTSDSFLYRRPPGSVAKRE